MLIPDVADSLQVSIYEASNQHFFIRSSRRGRLPPSTFNRASSSCPRFTLSAARTIDFSSACQRAPEIRFRRKWQPNLLGYHPGSPMNNVQVFEGRHKTANWFADFQFGQKTNSNRRSNSKVSNLMLLRIVDWMIARSVLKPRRQPTMKSINRIQTSVGWPDDRCCRMTGEESPGFAEQGGR